MVTGEPRETETLMRWFGEGALEKYPLGQLAGVLLYFMHRSGAAVGGAIRLSTVSATRGRIGQVFEDERR